jgi:hypothetical protein
MASRDSLEVRKLLSSGVSKRRVDDTSKAVRIRYIGAAGTPSINVTVATGVAMIDATASVPYTWANYATMGELVAAINASGLWEAQLLDALSTDVTLNSFKTAGVIASGTDENGVVVWDLVHDNNIVSDSAYFATVCLTPFYNFDAPKAHRVHATELSYYQDITAAEGGAVLYKRKKNGTATEVYSTISVDTTSTTINFANGEGRISGGEDEELVFRITTAGALADNALSYIRICGEVE